MYFFEGSAVCRKVMPLFAVTSSSCGTGRPAHLVVFAPGGGGGGTVCPPWAQVRPGFKKSGASAIARRTNLNAVECPMRDALTGSALFVPRRDHGLAAELSSLCKCRVRDQHRQRAILCGKRSVVDSACNRSAD